MACFYGGLELSSQWGHIMRRIFCVVICCCFLALPVWAQRGGGGRGGGTGGGRGMGGGGFRGGGAGGFRGGGFSGFRGGGFRGGLVGRGGFNRGFNGNRFFFRNGFFRNRAFFGAGFFPGFYGGFYDPFFWDYPAYPYASGYGSPYYGPDVTVISDGSYGYAEPPRIVINEGYRPEQPSPSVREYPPPQNRPESGAYEKPLYLIAFKTGIIRAALAYWVEDGTLHFVNMDGEVKTEPLTAVDRELSERLNHERHVGFSLPR